jgi:tetratricopeptide (TPR) repeat protein
MGIFGKRQTGPVGKLAPRLKQLERLFESGKLAESAAQLAKMWDEKTPETAASEIADLRSLRVRVCQALLAAGNTDESYSLAVSIADDEPSDLEPIAAAMVDKKFIDNRTFDLVRRAVAANDKNKRLLLALAKTVYSEKGDKLNPQEMDFLAETAKAYPLWKDGLSVLADHYLRDGRRDGEALTIYRNAYPNRKADRRLREVLLESLIVNNERDDFAASVYKDAVETSDNDQALKLLAEYFIEKDEFAPSTVPYIERALQRTKLGQESLRKLAELVLKSRSEYIDRSALCLAVYRQGYSDRNLLVLLAESLAEANKFDNESIEIMTKAFEQRVISKRAILILSEHCLANERDDEFAVRVYETYLSTWPDRPQRKIYEVLAHHYAGLTRVDDQAQKIYEEALTDRPNDSIVLNILARAYHAVDRRDDHAQEVYHLAFSSSRDEIRKGLAMILAEIHVAANDFNEDTLQYLTVMGRPTSGPLVQRYDEALTNCFLATGRRGEQAQQAYFALFERTENTPDLNPRLVSLLAELIKERETPPAPDTVEMRVYRKLFELYKFSTDASIAFVLLDDELARQGKLNRLNLAVRCFEADQAKFIELVKQHATEQLLLEVGDFYIEHFNFPLAAQAYQASFDLHPTDQIRYRLAKIHLLDGRGDLALQHLHQLDAQEFKHKRTYWEAAAYQMLGDPAKAGEYLDSLTGQDELPPYLLRLRKAINQELQGNFEQALTEYTDLDGDSAYPQFARWLGLERGILLLKLRKLDYARDHLEQVYRHNPNGRAEQLFFSIALFALAHEHLRSGNVDLALPLFTHAVEINRNHRLLRQVIVDVLSLHGENAFFEGKLPRAGRIMEVCHRILPKRLETKTLLAYTFHRLEDFSKAIIYYRDIAWTDDNPRLERSQAYAYMANNQPQQAWRVFLDLAKRGNLSADNFPRLVKCFLADAEAEEGHAWDRVEFPEFCKGIMLVALLIHDGQYARAVEELNRMTAEDPDNMQVHWYFGMAHSHMGKRDLAVHHWRELLRISSATGATVETKLRQFTEIGLAFVAAGYAQEAMQTWEELRKLDDKNPDLPALYAATLDLNGYQLARKEQFKLAREEWKKAVSYDPDNPGVVQNLAIVNLLLDEYEEATRQFHKLRQLWQRMINANPRSYGHLAKLSTFLEKAMNTLALTKGRPDFDLTKVRAEDAIDYYQKANQFYWILGLDKLATHNQIEREYFRLIKIFNPERHADDFMLVEEAYTNLFRYTERREAIGLFVLNPVQPEVIRARLTRMPADGKISFEHIEFPQVIPPPDYQQLTRSAAKEGDLSAPLFDLLKINLKIADWTLL